MFRKTLSLTVIICFSLTTLGPLPKAHADSVLGLPEPGTMVNLSPAYEPAIIKGLTVHKDNPFLFDFIVDRGQDKLSGEPLKKEGEKLIKYFLAGLAIPDKDVWVNLSPYEKTRMIPEALGQTDMGRDLLEQDYILKQITASLIYPEKQLGKTFWDQVYSKARQMYGTTQVPVNTFNKVWIMADRAEVFEHNQTAFVVDQHLKVMLEEDYLALQKHSSVLPLTTRNDTHSIGANIVREIILPELEKEVNTGKNFANLRQIFNSIILSSWYKRNLKQALLNQVYSNKSKINGIKRPATVIPAKAGIQSMDDTETIYQQYLKAYKKGVFNYIKEDINTANGRTLPRKYFSGGLEVGAASPAMLTVTNNPAMFIPETKNFNGEVDFATLASTDGDKGKGVESDEAMFSQGVQKLLFSIKEAGLYDKKDINRRDILEFVDRNENILENNIVGMGEILNIYKTGYAPFRRIIALLVPFFPDPILVRLLIRKITAGNTDDFNPYVFAASLWALIQIGDMDINFRPEILEAFQVIAPYSITYKGIRISLLDALKRWRSPSEQLRVRHHTDLLDYRIMKLVLDAYYYHRISDSAGLEKLFNNTLSGGSTSSVFLIKKIAEVGQVDADFRFQIWPKSDGSPEVAFKTTSKDQVLSNPLNQIFRMEVTSPGGIRIYYLTGDYESPVVIKVKTENQVNQAMTVEPLLRMWPKMTNGELRVSIKGMDEDELRRFHDALVAAKKDGNRRPALRVKAEDFLNQVGDALRMKMKSVPNEDLPERTVKIKKAKADLEGLLGPIVYGPKGTIGENSFSLIYGSIRLTFSGKGLNAPGQSIDIDFRSSDNVSAHWKVLTPSYELTLNDFQESRMTPEELVQRLKDVGVVFTVQGAAIDQLNEAIKNNDPSWIMVAKNNRHKLSKSTEILLSPTKSLSEHEKRYLHWQIIEALYSDKIPKIEDAEILIPTIRTLFTGGVQNPTMKILMRKLLTQGRWTDAAMLPRKVDNGGIDLNTANGMQWKVSKDGRGVEMNIDPAMIARVRREGIDRLSPVILSMTPVTSIWLLAGLQAPVK